MSSVSNILDILDKKKAGDMVDAIYEAEVAAGRQFRHLKGFMDRVNSGEEQVVVVKTGVPSYHRLFRITPDGGLEEVILAIPGVLIKSNLPPILSSLKNDLPKRARYARRGVYISGFDSMTFHHCAQELQGIHSIFEASGEAKNGVANMENLDYRGFPMISSSNNYFTLQSVVPYESFKKFSPQEDPFNILNDYVATSKEDLVRIDDNEVKTFKRVMTHDKSGVISSKILPQQHLVVHAGDIIQMQVSLAMFKLNGPNNKGKFGVRHILRSVALMDDTIRKHALDNVFKDTPGLWGPPLQLKRSVGYDDDEEQGEIVIEEVPAKQRRLAITYK